MENMNELEASVTTVSELDTEKYGGAFEEVIRIATDFAKKESTMDEMLEFLEKNRPALTDIMLSDMSDVVDDENDRNDVNIMVEEVIMSLARILMRVSEKNREEFYKEVSNEMT